MEGEMAPPEVVVFLKGSDHCHLFKDIRSHDKCCVVENCELDHNNMSSLLRHELDNHPTDVSEELMLYISTGVQQQESFSNQHHHHCLIDDVKLSGGGAQKKKLMIMEPPNPKEESFRSQNVDDAGATRIAKFSLFQLFNTMDDLGKGQQNVQIQENAVDHSSLEMDSDSGPESVKNEEDKSTEAENIYTLKEPLLLSSSSLSQQNTLGFADIGSASFSAASTASGRMTFSGPMQCCDNISLRSNSTTSTTSFAFPILATEWNESPIRMAEVERRRRRRSQKSTCWTMCFSCSNS